MKQYVKTVTFISAKKYLLEHIINLNVILLRKKQFNKVYVNKVNGRNYKVNNKL